MWKAVDLKTKMRVADAENYQTGPALGPSTKTAYNCIRMIQHGILNQQTIQNSSEPGLSYFSQLAKACWYQISRKKYITKKSPKELIKLAQNAIDARSQDRNSAENGNPESQILNLHQLFFVLFSSVNFVHRVMISFRLLMPSISLLVSSDDSEHILLNFNWLLAVIKDVNKYCYTIVQQFWFRESRLSRKPDQKPRRPLSVEDRQTGEYRAISDHWLSVILYKILIHFVTSFSLPHW